MLVSILIALAVSLDGVGVGISYSLRGIKLSPGSLSIICSLSALACLAGLLAGQTTAGLVPYAVSRWLGSLAFIGLGFFVLLEWLVSRALRTREGGSLVVTRFRLRSLGLVVQVLRDPPRADLNSSGHIEPLEAVILGVALALDAFAVGLGAGAVGLGFYGLPLIVGAFKFCFLRGGEMMGRAPLHDALRDKSALLSAIILIFLGISRAIGR